MGILRSVDEFLDRYLPSTRILLLLLVVVVALFAQIRYDQIGDRQGAGTKFWMANVGTSPPGTCTVGDMYFKTDATPGQNLYYCTATNTWTQQKDDTGGSIPTGTIAFFNLSNCPSGWSEYTALRGRYAVGLPSGGTLELTRGTALSNGENRAVGKHNHSFTPEAHTHTVNDPGHSHGITDPGHNHEYDLTYYSLTENISTGSDYQRTAVQSGGATTSSATTGITVNSATTGIGLNSTSATGTIEYAGSVDGTNAPYVQLLACRKD